jgi:hypothetical protein
MSGPAKDAKTMSAAIVHFVFMPYSFELRLGGTGRVRQASAGV